MAMSKAASTATRAARWSTYEIDLAGLPGLQQQAVRLVMHAVSHGRLHVPGGLAVDPIGLEHAMLDHHLHFRSVGRMHGAGGDVELVDEGPGVRHHEADGFAFLQADRLRLVVVVVHRHLDRAGDVAGFARRADLAGAAAVTVGAVGKRVG